MPLRNQGEGQLGRDREMVPFLVSRELMRPSSQMSEKMEKPLALPNFPSRSNPRSPQ